MPPTYVVVGAGLAGATAVATLRAGGFDGEMLLIGDEPQAPYERPPLSKDYPRGRSPLKKLSSKPPFYQDYGIDIRFGGALLSSRSRGPGG